MRRFLFSLSIFLFVCLVCIPSSFSMGKRVEKEFVPVRAQIAGGDVVELRIKSNYNLIDLSKNRIIFKSRVFRAKISVVGDSLRLSDGKIYPSRLFFEISSRKRFRLDGKLYRGSVELIAQKGKVIAVNHIALEDYLKSVVPSEISRKWKLDALEAQAVAARSFTYYHIITNKKRMFDVPLGRQEYHGVVSENPKTSWAVDVTYGQVLEYAGRIIPTYFSAVCGGYTEQADAVWSTSKNLPGVTKCDYCRNSRYFLWRQAYKSSEIVDRFNKFNYNMKNITDIDYGEKAPFFTPRLRSVIVRADGKNYEIRLNEFRKILGYGKIRSPIFSIIKSGKRYIFSGRGWGHGVGLCQYGAKTMAEQGIKYKDILSHYYPLAEIKRVY